MEVKYAQGRVTRRRRWGCVRISAEKLDLVRVCHSKLLRFDSSETDDPRMRRSTKRRKTKRLVVAAIDGVDDMAEKEEEEERRGFAGACVRSNSNKLQHSTQVHRIDKLENLRRNLGLPVSVGFGCLQYFSVQPNDWLNNPKNYKLLIFVIF